ncbi:MAG: pyruvate kinase [Clostridia bacterium]|nr:pyruvate kinase [Clostridia bacterium]
MRKTKIVGTIGPASIELSVMKKLVQAGLNVVRINLSHAKIEDMNKILKNVKQIRRELKVPLPIMVDTRGPEIRVRTFKEGSVKIKKGQKFIFTGKDIEGDETAVSLNCPEIVKCIKVGNKILAVNGLLAFKVVEIVDKDIITKAMNSGVISNRKSLSIPGVKFSTPYLNAADKKDLLWAIENDIDFVAASFVNSKEDVLTLRRFIAKNNGDMKIISKIESLLGVKNMDEIIDASDGLMVARGDLGVEVPMSKLPNIQKTMIKKSVSKGKAVITATEMLESMITSNRPTRAEVSDVANAVYDGTSCIMLSGETAAGKYPVEAVKIMSDVAEETEKHIKYASQFTKPSFELSSSTDMISHSAVDASFSHNIKAIVSFTHTGLSAGMISRFRPSVKVLGLTPTPKTYRQLDLIWGVTPLLTPVYNTTDEMFDIADDLIKKKGYVKSGDSIIVTCGPAQQPGKTNIMKITEIK